MKEPRDAYKVLQVDPEADDDVISAAYRRLAQKYHPDVAGAGPTPDAAARMIELNAAWDQVRDPVRRAAYDRRRAAAASAGVGEVRVAPREAPAPAPRGPSASSGPSGTGFGGDVGSAGPPPGRPSGSVLNFGRYGGWSLGEISRTDPGYLEWLDRMPIGRPYRVELDAMLRKLGRRLGEAAEAEERRGLFRRR